ECLCGGEVDDQIEFSPEFDRQVAGLFAFENPANVDGGGAISIRLTWSVADQAANLSVLALIIHRRQGMPGCERHELPALTEEEYTGVDEQPARARLHDLCEGGMEFTLVGGVHHQDLPSDGTGRILQVSRPALTSGPFGSRNTARIDASGTNAWSLPSTLACNGPTEKTTPVILPPGRLMLATSPTLTGSAPMTNTIGVVAVAALPACAAGTPALTITATCLPMRSATSPGSPSS